MKKDMKGGGNIKYCAVILLMCSTFAAMILFVLGGIFPVDEIWAPLCTGTACILLIFSYWIGCWITIKEVNKYR